MPVIGNLVSVLTYHWPFVLYDVIFIGAINIFLLYYSIICERLSDCSVPCELTRLGKATLHKTITLGPSAQDYKLPWY